MMRFVYEFLLSARRKMQDFGCLPLSKVEIVDIVSQPGSSSRPCDATEMKVQGVDVWETDYAPEIRANCNSLTMPVVQIGESNIVDCSTWQRIVTHDPVWDRIYASLKAHIVSDTREINVEAITDPWLRAKLRWPWLQRRFPIRKTTFTIQGRVLYPYLKPSLPYNRHTVKFAVR